MSKQDLTNMGSKLRRGATDWSATPWTCMRTAQCDDRMAAVVIAPSDSRYAYMVMHTTGLRGQASVEHLAMTYHRTFDGARRAADRFLQRWLRDQPKVRS